MKYQLGSEFRRHKPWRYVYQITSQKEEAIPQESFPNLAPFHKWGAYQYESSYAWIYHISVYTRITGPKEHARNLVETYQERIRVL